MSKAIVIGYLAKVSAANVNASHTEGNVVVAKKVTLPDGSTIPYISGQAVRRMLRDRLEELGYPLSEPFAQVSGQEVTPPVRPWEFVDEDLFGYLDPSGGRRRTSPVRVSAAVGLFPFQGDRDLGTRSFERFGQAMAAGGNMFETELYANLFKGTVLVELDRVGVFRPLEIGEDAERALGTR
jgi:CRISPR-associated protein Cst2